MKALIDIVYKFWGASIRRQLILGIIAVHAVLMSIFVFDLVERQRDFLHSQSLAQARSLALSLSTNSSSWLLANDIVGLEEILETQREFPSLRYAMVLSPQGRVIGHTEKDKVGLYLHDEISARLSTQHYNEIILINNNRYIDIAYPIINNGKFIGWARINLSQKTIADNLMIVTRDGLLYTLLAILVGALFAFFMAGGITRALLGLVNVAEEVKEGDITVRATITRHDEVGKLSENLNRMLDTISNSRRDLQAIMDNSPDVIYVKDSSGRFIFVNRQFEISLGSEKSKILGKTFYDFFSKEIADEMQSTDKNVFQDGKVVETNITVPTPNRLLSYRSAKFPLYDENNSIYAICVLSTDTTASMKMEAEKSSLEKQLFQAQKMQAIGQLTGGIAHDFNNLLAVILGYTELCQIKYAVKEDELKKYLQAIESAGIRGRDLIEQMMIYSRNDHIETSSIRVEPVLEETIRMLKATFPATIGIQTSISPNMPPVQCHSGLLSQVLMNLCLNAKDSMTLDGCLKISLLVDDINEQLCMSCHGKFSGQFVVIEITDTGSGIDEDILTQIFEPFFTSKNTGEGTGMGLSVVHGIVHKSDGHIAVTSTSQQGTCFRVYLPALSENQKEGNLKSAGIAKSIDHQYDFSELAIMVVDDELAVAQYLTESLQMQHATVKRFTNSRLALQYFKEEGANIDIVVTDQTMPNLSGIQLSSQLLSHRADVNIVLCTGHTDSVTEDSALALGIKSFLYKPFDTKKLNSIINKLR